MRVGQRRVRVRQSDLDRFLEAGATGNRAAQQWARLGSALAGAAARLGDEDREMLEGAIQELSDAAGELADVISALPDVGA